jgi:large subunit ribosomal protein L10
MKTTGLSRVSKDTIIREIDKELKNNTMYFVTQQGKTSAFALDGLRSRLRKANGRYLVVKNSLAKKALEKHKIEKLPDGLSGTCGIVFSNGDPVASSKILMEFAKANEGFAVSSAYVSGAYMAPEQVKVLATLPSREVLLARVVGGIQAPISSFVNVLSGTLRKVVLVLDAVAKKKGSA